MSPYDYKLKNAKTIQHMSREENFSEQGAQKNRLDETVLFSTHNNVWVGRDQTIYAFMH